MVLANNVHVAIWSNFRPTKVQRAVLSKDRWRVVKIPELSEDDRQTMEAHRAAQQQGLNLLPFPAVFGEPESESD